MDRLKATIGNEMPIVASFFNITIQINGELVFYFFVFFSGVLQKTSVSQAVHKFDKLPKYRNSEQPWAITFSYGHSSLTYSGVKCVFNGKSCLKIG